MEQPWQNGAAPSPCPQAVAAEQLQDPEVSKPPLSWAELSTPHCPTPSSAGPAQEQPGSLCPAVPVLHGTLGCWLALPSSARGSRQLCHPSLALPAFTSPASHSPVLLALSSTMLAQTPQAGAAAQPKKAGSKMQSPVRPDTKVINVKVILRVLASFTKGESQTSQ